ncbi:ABC transporter permease [Streptomyces badius]
MPDQTALPAPVTGSVPVAGAAAPAPPAPAAAGGDGAPRRRGARRHRWPVVVPFFAFLAVCFGLPAGTMVYGAFTVLDPESGRVASPRRT